ncbi:hydrogen gas-evolving membrane-bound hydrogenase subunit E [Arenibaculum pallidiluteum]|uniref:hydrogen gas-evolving membrane-bound hydrogenase subunit E n=1 Tax=Arenibaculum pallidiluteum TaxID=2812559 RepID=UPI001A96C42F|nr:hydrogen gas-evolving membrane-bound hydrogenase subunit E [Arenibaculum pallidiluteum]
MITSVLLPIGLGAAATVAAMAMPPRLAMPFATMVAAAAFVLLLWAVPQVAGGAAITASFWGVPSLGITGGLSLDGLSLLFALLITGIGALVFLYAGSYLHDDPRRSRFAAIVLMFMTAMLGAVMADDVVTLFIFWELTSLASFFLVGFDHEKATARRAALQALLVTGGGGLALLAGLVLVAAAAGTTAISGIIAAREAVLAAPAAEAAMILVIIGCFAKSAQVPLHFWLPNAMAAPTPVSAYLHSATMVKLGVYLLARLNPVYLEHDLWQGVLTWFGLATALTGAFLALRETDLKRVLAYTTVTGLGTLVMLIGIPPALSATAAIVFLLVHAFYKAALFLVAGIVDHETGMRDASALGGLARVMPITALGAVLAALSMAGLPPFVGFVAKELVYEAKLESGDAAGLLVAGGFLVNAAMVAIAGVLSFRLFFARPRPTPKAPHDPGWAMMTGPLVLGILGLLAGGIPSLFGSWLVNPAAAALLGESVRVDLALWHGFSPLLVLSIATVAMGVGLYLAWERLGLVLRSLRQLDRFGPARAYDRVLGALVPAAARVTGMVQHGSLRDYLRTLFLVASLGALITLAFRGGISLPSVEAGWPDPRIFVPILLIAGAVAAVLARTLIAAIMASGLVGFATAVLFLVNGAPDLAFTQFAVETLFVVILAATLVRLPLRGRLPRSPRDRWIDASIAGCAGGAMTLLLLAVLATPFDPRLSVWFGAESVPAAHGRNVVNVILVDFRALDTLGEITVLALAAIAVLAVLRSIRGETRA